MNWAQSADYGIIRVIKSNVTVIKVTVMILVWSQTTNANYVIVWSQTTNANYVKLCLNIFEGESPSDIDVNHHVIIKNY
jgi:hypothetical protein